ncbi:PAS domain-containing protein [Lacimonas salitolerans]|uniref:PAS domain-containing protein n=1 Tax=Lacimonas salitolerans TaxID=1323750 RepID=A0ABW4EKB3_9RHOB
MTDQLTPRLTLAASATPVAGRSRLAQVEAYWTALFRDGQPPARAQIDPRGIEAALEHAFVAERITPTEARIRVGGHHLSDLLGMEVRGMPVSSLIAPEARAAFGDTLRALFDRTAICRLTLRSPGAIGQPDLTARLLLLPLRGDGNEISRALGCLISDGVIGRAPRRFGITDTTTAPLAARRVTQPAPGMADPPKVFTPHLRLVKSD